jgi:hypothetical protein
MAFVDAIFDRAVNEKSNPILVDPKGKQHGKIDPILTQHGYQSGDQSKNACESGT